MKKGYEKGLYPELLLGIDDSHEEPSPQVQINIENDVKALGCNFLRENSLILKYSILLSDQKEHILNGGNI